MSWIFVDDGSPKMDRPDDILRAIPGHMKKRIRLLRVEVDIPWNQHGARNLGAQEASTEWLFMTDIDRCLMAFDAKQILRRKLDTGRYYKPVSFVPNMNFPTSFAKQPTNQFLITRKAYWWAGGYDEDYCGSYGGDVSYLKIVERKFPLDIMPDVRLIRYDSEILPGATTTSYSRPEYQSIFEERKRKKREAGDTKPKNPIRFPWHEVRL